MSAIIEDESKLGKYLYVYLLSFQSIHVLIYQNSLFLIKKQEIVMILSLI